MSIEEDAKARATDTYNAASDYYNHPANSFWERFGRRTVERLQLPAGARVLDVCCGSGASAIPAAEAVGPNGFVLGVDLAENLLELARRKADEQGLKNTNFRAGDLLNLHESHGSFDAVVCVFGIFFVPDMHAAVSELWKLVRPGGKLAITTWGPRFFEPASTAFWNSIRTIHPELYKGFNPWDRITDPNALRELMPSHDVAVLEIEAEAGEHYLKTPEDWWPMVLGSGYRGTVERLSAAEREKVHQENLAFIRESELSWVEAHVVYAVAVKAA